MALPSFSFSFFLAGLPAAADFFLVPEIALRNS